MAEVRLPRNPIALADHADGFIATLGTPIGLAASGLTAAQITDLTSAMTALRSAVSAKDAAELAFRGAVETEEGAHEAAEALYRALRQQANHYPDMTDGLRAQAGLTVSDDEPTPGGFPTVADLTAQGRPTGSNFLDWSGPTGGNLRYEVYSRLASGGDWALVGSATATDFLHQGAGAGVARYYHVVACRGRQRGEPSNEAAVYTMG